MSRELIDEFIDKLEENNENLGNLIEGIVEYGFADENDLCRVLEIDSTDLDYLVSGESTYSEKQLKLFNRILIKYLKKVKKTYEHLYYKGA